MNDKPKRVIAKIGTNEARMPEGWADSIDKEAFDQSVISAKEAMAPASTDDLVTIIVRSLPQWWRVQDGPDQVVRPQVLADILTAAGFVRGDVAKAEALEEAANDVSGYSAEYWRHSEEQRYFRPWHANWLRSRAAEYRAAAQEGDGQ